MAILNRVRHALGIKKEGKLFDWWPAGVIVLTVPLALWLVSGLFAPAIAVGDGTSVASPDDEDEARRDGEERERERGGIRHRENDEGVERRERQERERRGQGRNVYLTSHLPSSTIFE